MLDGYHKCSSCTKKGVKECDGNFSVEEFDCLTAKRNRLVEAARRKGEELQQLLASAAKIHAERERLQKESDDLLEKQKKMLLREANALDELDHLDPPPQASSTVLVGMDDRQLEELFELEPGALLDFSGPVPLDHPSS
jgi:hypothetical protein